MYLVGIDCSTNPRDVGIALAELGDTIRVCEVHTGTKDPWRKVADWLLARDTQSALIALDAPLGWPSALANELTSHSAGSPVRTHSNEVFRRFTDRHIKCSIGQQPLDVGADRIARTAHATLKELSTLRERCGTSIPLAWWKDNIEGIHAIEVYPAATLISHGLPCDKYKDKRNPDHRCVREEIATNLPDIKLAGNCLETALDNADGLDAVVCLLAAADFVRGDADPPPKDKNKVVYREGWIWCRKAQSQSARASGGPSP